LHDESTLLVQHDNLVIRTTVTLPVSRPYNHDLSTLDGFDSLIDPLALVDGFFFDPDCSSLLLL